MSFRPFLILSLLLVLGVGIFLTLLRINSKSLRGSLSNTSYKVKEAAEKKALSSITLNTKANSGEQLSFNYTPEKPVNGILKGVVEIGSIGFNAFVIHVDKEKRWELIYKDFGVSLVYEGMTTAADIESGIDKYMKNLFDNAVRKEDVHFIISSGAQKAPNIQNILAALEKKGFRIYSVNPDEEARFAFLAAVPSPFRRESFVVDIGSGNTKIAWLENSIIHTEESAGSKYYQSKVPDSIVYNDIKQKISTIPAVQRAKCFILGGVPYLMANLHRAGEERYTLLQKPINYDSKNERAACGLNIYKALTESSGGNMFIFDWNANFSIGYLLNLKENN